MMRKSFLFAAIMVSLSASAATDYQCVNNCTSSGSLYQFCVEKCTYDATPAPAPAPRIDYQCMNDCTDKGYLYGYCKSRCSY